ncbi:metalloprotease [Rhodotorula kratochvilovae]
MQRQSQPYDLSKLGAGWKEQTQDGHRFAVFEREIEVSQNDDRTYRFLTLANGLKALLISDPKTDKAAAALGVQVGHLSDPDDLPGLAHFCEHMLFLGTEKFPDEAEYKTYLSRNSGSSNAYTSLAETVYHFDSSPAGLPGALARHAQFFTAPLFDASCTERELNAVDSEFRRNLQLDARRLFQLGKATSSRENGAVYWKFGTGSKETLWEEPRARGVDVRERLLEWYAQKYSANLMTLTVLSYEPYDTKSYSLDELTSLVLAEYSDIPNANLVATEFPSPPITAKEAQTEISYRTVKDTPQLRVEFGLPDMREHWATKPGRFISHYIGHEGPGSILAELKAHGWATSLSASSANGAAGFDFFRVSISLTAVGLKHYKDVLAVLFAYLDLLKSTPPQEWAFLEARQLGETAWRWKEKGQPQSTVRNLASQLGETLYPPEKMLVGPWFATRWDEKLVKETMGYLRAENCRVFVGSKEPLEGRKFWTQTEKYYGTEYNINPLELKPVDPSIKLALPDRNIFVPEKLELVTKEPAPVMRPSLIRQTPRSRLFHKRDDLWIIPRGTAYFRLRSPIADDSARSAMLTQLVTSLVEESLAKYSYDATLAGLDYSLGTDAGGALLVVSGYTDKLPLLASVVVDKLKAFAVDKKEYEIVHDRLVRAYKNARLQNPSSLADAEIRRFTRQTYWTWDQRLEALQALTPAGVEKHAKELISRLSIDSLVHGNFRSEAALDLLDAVETKLAASEVDAAELDYHRALKLPAGSTTVFRPPVPSPENVNSAAAVYYEVGSAADYDLLAKLSLFGQIAKVPVFSTLRTKEQLGYIVSSSPWVLNALAGFRIIVQSERTGEYLDERISALEATLGEHLAQMSDEDFDKEKESLAAKKLEKPKSLGQETGRYWQEIETGELDFHHRERQAALIRKVTKPDLVAFFDQFISPSSPSRTKLSILMRSQRFQPAALEAFLGTVRAAAPEEMSEAEKLVADKPTLAQLEAFAGVLGGEGAAAVHAEVEKLRALPPLSAGTQELKPEEVEAFRRGLERAEGYKPVLEEAHETARL